MWIEWIQENWSALVSGVKIVAPSWFVAPLAAGFERCSFASPEGQVADWVLPFTDGSRVHVHEFADGVRVVHRDKYDPHRSLDSLVAHIFKETPWGKVGLAIGVFALLVKLSEA